MSAQKPNKSKHLKEVCANRIFNFEEKIVKMEFLILVEKSRENRIFHFSIKITKIFNLYLIVCLSGLFLCSVCDEMTDK